MRLTHLLRWEIDWIAAAVATFTTPA